ncbi:MAG TPA: ROK family transcriptional regulator [Alphaproteobacteria bacterium]|nr:ROK family transcriptional regulator [Alphaproteobacteria bacterium]
MAGPRAKRGGPKRNRGQATMQTGDSELMRAINRFHVLDAIRRFEPISRVEIGERTRLSRATVSAITADLIEEGLLSADEGEPGATAARGRPRVMLRMNPQAAHVVGVKLSMHQVSISVTNLKAEVLTALTLPVRPRRLEAEVVADLLEDGIRSTVAKAGLDMAGIAGIGIGIPGFIDAMAGVVQWSPIFGQGPLPFAAMVGRRLGVSAVIENDANLVTLAERWFGHGQDVDNFVVVTVEHGVGMGLFLGGELYRGHHGMGAEFGHTKHDRQGPPCRCGQRGCVEAYAADYAILRDAQRLLDFADIEDDAVAERTIRQVTELARAGDAGLQALFARAGEVLGLGIANVVNVLDPARIIVSGGGVRAGDLFGPALREAVEANVLRSLAGRCQVVIHDWGDEVWARGAASLVLQGLYRAPWSRGARIEMAV